MTDIVERLRAYGGDEMLHQSAADEIERLQKDKTQIAEVAARLEAELYAVLCERNEQAEEIVRLRAALQKIAMNKLESRAKLEDIARRALEPKP